MISLSAASPFLFDLSVLLKVRAWYPFPIFSWSSGADVRVVYFTFCFLANNRVSWCVINIFVSIALEPVNYSDIYYC